MKHTKLLLGLLAISATLVGCPGPSGTDAGTPTGDAGRDGGGGTGDAGRDAGGGTDTGPSDTGPDAFSAPDVGVPVTCAGYCTQLGTSCTTTHAQYTDMAACMAACTNAGWTMGTQADTTGNTLGCRVYHAIAAVADPNTHCAHAGFLGGGSSAGPCSPWRAEGATEGHPTATAGAYVRVDRMGMPAVATALIGPGTMPATSVPALKDTYNDGSPNTDAAFAAGIPLLTAIGTYHFLLDGQLRTAGFAPCSVVNSFPFPGAPVPVPACGAQDYSGGAAAIPITSGATGTAAMGHAVAQLIIPDTLRLDTTPADSHFPNGRNLQDDVINPILAVLLLNLSPCQGSPTGTTCPGHTTTTGDHGMAACTADTNCTWNAGAMTCNPAGTTRAATCGALTGAACNPGVGCTTIGTSCVPVPCEALGNTATTGLCSSQAGCSVATCSGGPCTVGSLVAAHLTPHTNDVVYPATNPFPYFLAHH